MVLILASTSPQRKKLLADAGYSFESVDPGDAEDSITSAATPTSLAVAKACAKAEAVVRTFKRPGPAIVIGADTLVALGPSVADVIGKPLDRTDAKCILNRLSGTRHEVISGLCVWPIAGSGAQSQGCWMTAVSTFIQMRSMTPEEIDAYVDSGESDGKAGAYAIQEKGDCFVASVDGSFANVVGFPIEVFQKELPRLLKKWNFNQR